MDVDYWYAGPDHALALHSADPGLHRYDRHSHDEYSIILLTAGSKILRVGADTMLVSPGQIVIVPPGTSHDCEPNGATDWGHRCLYVSPELMVRVTGDASLASAPPKLQALVDAPLLSRRLLAWHVRTAARPGSGIDDEGALLLAAVMEEARLEAPATERAPATAARRVRHYLLALERDLSRKLDLDGLAALAGVSRFQVIRDVRSTLHTTPGRLLRDLRLREAKRLIRKEVPVAQVSAMTGFADQSHLVRSFKGSYAITPGQYREAGWVPDLQKTWATRPR